jgi:hypothetical protein
MKTTNRRHLAGKFERFGLWLGRAWRGFDRRAAGVMRAFGLPEWAVTVIKLALLGVLLYVAFMAVFWMALLLLVVVVGGWVAENSISDNQQEPEWRNGAAGFGLYTYDGYRIDPHVHDED